MPAWNRAKTISTIILIILFAVCLTWACAYAVNRTVSHAVASQPGAAQTSTPDALSTHPSAVETVAAGADLEETLRHLVENNIACLELFARSPLPHNSKAAAVQLDGCEYFPALPGKYNSIEDLEALLHDTYLPQEAQSLLQDGYNATGQPLYKMIDGQLYVNTSHSKNAKDTIRWGNYTIDIIELTMDQCTFHVDVLSWSHSLNRYVVRYPQLLARYQNGGWRLQQLYTGIEEEDFRRVEAKKLYEQNKAAARQSTGGGIN